jgi:hypothetical protein
MVGEGVYAAGYHLLNNPHFAKSDAQIDEEIAKRQAELKKLSEPDYVARRAAELEQQLRARMTQISERDELKRQRESTSVPGSGDMEDQMADLKRRSTPIPQVEDWGSLADTQASTRLVQYRQQQAGKGPGPDDQPILDEIKKLEEAKRVHASGRIQNGWQDVADWFHGNAVEAGDLRQAIRDALPVDKEFADSFTGQVIQGVGQLATLPTYAVPGLGPAVSVAQLYQEGRDDYRQTMERRGLPVDEEQMNRAATEYVVGAAPLDILVDKLIIGKALKAAKGKVTVGQLAKTFALLGAAGGAGEGTQQLWLNVIAKELEKYDPERRLDDQVVRSVFVGGLVSGLGGSATHAAGAALRPPTFEQQANRAAAKIERKGGATPSVPPVEVPGRKPGEPLPEPLVIGAKEGPSAAVEAKAAAEAIGAARSARARKGAVGATGSKGASGTDGRATSKSSKETVRFAQSGPSAADTGRLWFDIARLDGTAFLGPTPTTEDLPSILRTLGGPLADHVTVVPETTPGGHTWGYTFKEPSGHILLDLSEPQEMYVHSRYAGEQSTLIYQAIYAWAHNTGNTIVEDPTTLSHEAKLRRTSQMLSSVLRFRTTRHVKPGPHSGIQGWREGDGEDVVFHNAGLLARREAELVRERLPFVREMRYVPEEAAFYDGNQRIPNEGLDDYLEGRIEEIDPDFAQATGPRTVRRALVTVAADETHIGDSWQRLGSSTEAPESLKAIRYAQAAEQEGKSQGSNPAPAAERAAYDQQAERWMRVLRGVTPAAADAFELKVQSRAKAAHELNTEVPETAQAAIHRKTIYLFQEALSSAAARGNERAHAVRLLQHEVGHPWWDTLSAAEKQALSRLAKVEVTNRTGPLYENQTLKPGVMDFSEAGVIAGDESQIREWFSERVAMANDAWAQKKAAIADHDGSLPARAAAKLRTWLFDGTQALKPDWSQDFIAAEFRKVMRRGSGVLDVDSEAARFAKVGQTLREAEATMVEDTSQVPLLNIRMGNEQIARQAAEVVRSWSQTIKAADGTGVDLRVADRGSLGARVFHLIRRTETNSIDPEKAAWLSRVPETLANAQVRLDDTQEKSRIYVRRYAGGMNHAVVVRPDGTVLEQRAFTGHLETHFPIKSLHRTRQQYLRADWVAPRVRE